MSDDAAPTQPTPDDDKTASNPHAQLRVIADMSGMKLQRVYELFRLPTAPPPVAHVACVPVYEIASALAFIAARATPDD